MQERVKKIALPIGVLLIGVFLFVFLTTLRPEPEKVPRQVAVPLVQAEEVNSVNERFEILAGGTVQPTREISLIPQVSGAIVALSPQMKAGGFFRTGDVLFEIDSTDYRLLVETALAEVAQREVQLEIEQEEAKVAKQEWEMYQKGTAGEPSKLLLREPQLKLARANLNAAIARLKIARTNLLRTSIRAPFNGRVKAKLVDLGQFVAPGSVLAVIFNTDRAEIQVPLKNADLRWIDVPLKHASGNKPSAVVNGTLAGQPATWNGYLDRIEGQIDPKDRMINAVVVVPGPYGGGQKAPLLSGLYVDVVIDGKAVPSIFKIPGYAVREDNKVWIAKDGKLEIRSVNILRISGGFVYTDSGLSDGDRLITSSLGVVVEGMSVREEVNPNE